MVYSKQVQTLGQKYLLEYEMATHSYILVRKIPQTERPDRLQSIVAQRVRQDSARTHARIWQGKQVTLTSFPSSRSVVSNSLWPNGLQHARLPCPSPTPRAYSNSHPSSQWCHPNISSSVVPFSSCLQSWPASGFFSLSQFFTSGGQNRSFTLSISPSNEYSELISFTIDWINLAVQETLKSLLQHHSSKASVLQCLAFFTVQLSHPYMTTWKTIALTRWTFKVVSLLFNMLSRFDIAFLPRSKRFLISWLQSPSAMILEPQKIKSVTVSIFFPI